MSEKSSSVMDIIGGILAAGAAYNAAKKTSRAAGVSSKPRYRNTKQSRRIAAHEAGHALVAWKFGNEIGSVIIGDRDGDNQADHGLVADVDYNSDPWQRCALYMGGVVGEGFVVGQYDPVYAQSDLQVSARAAHEILEKSLRVPWRRPGGKTVRLNCMKVLGLPEEHRAIMEEAASYAKTLIRRNRGAFEAIRNELMAKGTISEEEFAELVSQFEQ